MREFFKPDDFYSDVVSQDNYAKVAARVANEKLNELIESWPELYAFKDAKFHDGNWSPMSKFPNKNPTHRARLAFIEKIVQEPCKHQAIFAFDAETGDIINCKCKHCGSELEATWKLKESIK
jgi:acetone carboxylase gamma subunit